MNTTDLTTSEEVDAYLRRQNDLDLLRFITCGSVDDGKSTLPVSSTLPTTLSKLPTLGRSGG